MKPSFNRILSIALLAGLLFTQVAVHFLHTHDEVKSDSELVVSATDSLCLACSMDFTAALFYSVSTVLIFTLAIEIFYTTAVTRRAIYFSIFQIGRAPPVIA